MFSKDWKKFRFLKSRGNSSYVAMNKSSLITVYIVLYVLREMRAQLGLEASLEYARKYMEKIERHDSKIKGYVNKALFDMDVERMYEDSIGS